MKQLCIVAALALAGCATTPAGLAETRVEKSVTSQKTAQVFALCVAENVSGAILRDDGARYWVLLEVFGTPRHRWDFIPTETGSIAELRSTGIAGDESGSVEDCA